MVKHATRALAALLLVVAVQAPARELTFREDREGVFVVRVSPADVNVIAFSGKVVDGRFRSFLFTPARFTGMPDDGYIVGKAKVGEVVAITDVGSRALCADGTAVTFDVKAGQIAYVGDVTHTPTEKSFAAEVSDDLEAARGYMRRAHPQWADRLERVDHAVLRPAKDACPSPGGTTIYIPISR